MSNFESLGCSLIFFSLCLVNSGCNAGILDSNEGDICITGKDNCSDHICRRFDDCTTLIEGLKIYTTNLRNPQVCSFDKKTPIVCCPPDTTILLRNPIEKNVPGWKANEMCQQYSQLVYSCMEDPALTLGPPRFIRSTTCVDVETLITNGTNAVPMEFPHMVLIGYNKEKIDKRSWLCGGSLISDQWILTAAHCSKIVNSPACRARLGELNYLTENDRTSHQDYKIDQHIIHPNYQPSLTGFENDICLMRLEKKVIFSEFVRPICLNTNSFLEPTGVVATGWGMTSFGGPKSSDLLKANVNIVPAKKCSDSYSVSVSNKIPNRIVDDSMICAGSSEGKDTCQGDSGGPIQIQHPDYTCMHIQIGITSHGNICGSGIPSVYTRVSKYIQWIEDIVWP